MSDYSAINVNRIRYKISYFAKFLLKNNKGNLVNMSGEGNLRHLFRVFLKCMFIFLSIGLPLSFPSCSKENLCLFDTIAYMKISFYSLDEDEGEFVETPVDTFSAAGVLPGSLIYFYNAKTRLSDISLPLSNLSDTTRYIFSFNSEQMFIDTLTDDTTFTYDPILDTIDFVYLRQLYMITPVCGFGYNYELEEVFSTDNFVDSTRINYPQVLLKSQGDAENIQLFY